MLSTPRGLLSTFAATRLVLFAIGVFAVSRMPINAVEARGFHLPPQPHTFLEAWARYDACWYVAIAEDGYRGPIGPYGDMRPAFFPLFPALVTMVTPLVHTPLLAGLIVSNACYLAFLFLLWQIVRLDWTMEVTRRTVWIYLLFPSTVFLSGVYSESLLLALTTGACWRRAAGGGSLRDSLPASPLSRVRWASSSSPRSWRNAGPSGGLTETPDTNCARRF
jgi:Gpi18-like mannosyltransferase